MLASVTAPWTTLLVVSGTVRESFALPWSMSQSFLSTEEQISVAMKKHAQTSSSTFQPFQNGQVWKMDDSILQIRLVGKTLVHYKHYQGQAKRPPILLIGKTVLDRFLQQHDAVLLPEPAL
jgi:hypothetical protein